MVEWYFYLEKGKAQGPVEKDELLAAFKKGSLGPLDLVYKKGQSTWLPAFEHKDFQFLFKDQKLEKFSPIANRKWILLKKKKPEEGRGFRQVGPFSESDVKQKIQSGEFSYQDYAWTSGLKKWTPLDKLDEFNPKSKTVEISKIFPDEEIDEEVIKAPLREPPKVHLIKTAVESVPQEAGTKDLTRPWEPDVESEPKKTQAVKPKKPQTFAAQEPPPPPAEGVSTWLMRLSIFGMSLAVVTLVLVLSSSPNSLKWPRWTNKITQLWRGQESVVAPSQPAPQQTIQPSPVSALEPPKVQPSSPSAAPPAQVVEPKPPRSISARLTGGDTLEFITEGSYHFPIRVRLFGQVGKVYSKTGIYKDVQVRWRAGEEPKLSLRNLKLPKGDFVLWLSQHEVEKIQGIRVEDLGGSHFQKISEAKKWQSTDFNSERRDLIFLSGDYAALSEELERFAVKLAGNKSAWQKFYSGWLRKKISAERNRGIAPLGDLKQRQLPWSWFQLQDGVDRLTQKGQVYHRAIREGKFAQLSQTKEDLTKVFQELRGDVIRTKLFN